MFFVPSAYPGSPEGTAGTSSLGEFWRQDLANAGAEKPTKEPAQASTIP
jgi:hypothetical protein